MKKLSLKNKLMLAAAALILLVLAYNAGGDIKKPDVSNEITTAAVSDSTETISETAAEPDTETVSAEVLTEPLTESVTETTTVQEPVTETASVMPAAETVTKKAEPIPTEQTKEAKKTEAYPAEALPEQTACTLSVSCASILNNIDDFDQNKLYLLPADGVILPPVSVPFAEDDTVFDVLKREMLARGIHLEFSQVPAYNSVYIEGINNIYEFDCGELSGWMYTVNGEFPGYGCNMYKLKNGDTVEWKYTCDLGRDVGDDYSEK